MKPHETVVTCVGLNHQTSPVEEREQLAFSPDELPDAVATLGETLGGAVILSTCNRTELYATLPQGSDHTAQLVGLLNQAKGTAA